MIFLRSRYYEPVIARFFQQDPSRLEENLYAYAASNPINMTDPAGLFSPELIAKSMGASSFDTLIQALALTMPPPLLPDDDKWGFFAALLDAQDGDSLSAGSIILMTGDPYVQYRSPQRLWLKNCDQIMVGNRSLEDYFDNILVMPTPRDFPAEFWRDTSPSYYLLSGQRTASKIYVDGSKTTDLPDFHSFVFSIGAGRVGLNITLTVDQFGNQYVNVPDISGDLPAILASIIKYLTGRKFNLVSGGLAYSEGYVCTGYYSSGCVFRTPSLTDDSYIKNLIIGPCTSGGAVIGVGGTLVVCGSGSRAIIYSWGPMIGIGINGSLGWQFGNDISLGWNWAIRDRLEGVSYIDVLLKSKRR